MGKQNNRKKVKANATRIICGVLAFLMVAATIATIITTIASC